MAKLFIEKYDKAASSDLTNHKIHRVAHYLASTNFGCLGCDFRNFAAGHSMSEALRTEITAYQLCVLDDSMQEGPHAFVSRCVTQSRSSRPAWLSSSIRLNQNIYYRDMALTAHPGRMEWYFKRWKLLGQSIDRPYSRGIVLRISTKRFCSMVYRTGDHNIVDWSQLKLTLSDAPAQKSRTVRRTCIEEIKK